MGEEEDVTFNTLERSVDAPIMEDDGSCESGFSGRYGDPPASTGNIFTSWLGFGGGVDDDYSHSEALSRGGNVRRRYHVSREDLVDDESLEDDEEDHLSFEDVMSNYDDNEEEDDFRSTLSNNHRGNKSNGAYQSRTKKGMNSEPQECSSDQSVMQNTKMLNKMIFNDQIKTCSTAAALAKNINKGTVSHKSIAVTTDDDATASVSKDSNTDTDVDADVRQRDIYCRSHGGVENLILRQYPSIPTPNAPDHVLLKVEVRQYFPFAILFAMYCLFDFAFQ